MYWDSFCRFVPSSCRRRSNSKKIKSLEHPMTNCSAFSLFIYSTASLVTAIFLFQPVWLCQQRTLCRMLEEYQQSFTYERAQRLTKTLCLWWLQEILVLWTSMKSSLNTYTKPLEAATQFSPVCTVPLSFGLTSTSWARGTLCTKFDWGEALYLGRSNSAQVGLTGSRELHWICWSSRHQQPICVDGTLNWELHCVEGVTQNWFLRSCHNTQWQHHDHNFLIFNFSFF